MELRLRRPFVLVPKLLFRIRFVVARACSNSQGNVAIRILTKVSSWPENLGGVGRQGFAAVTSDWHFFTALSSLRPRLYYAKAWSSVRVAISQ